MYVLSMCKGTKVIEAEDILTMLSHVCVVLDVRVLLSVRVVGRQCVEVSAFILCLVAKLCRICSCMSLTLS